MEKFFDSIFCDDEYKLTHMSDGKFLTEDGYVFDIHRFAIAESSSYFYELVFGSTTTDSSNILIPDIKGIVLDKILYYIYTGKFICRDDILIDLLTFSHRFLLYNLQLEVKEFIENNICSSNCVQVLLTSRDINQQDIFNTCFRFFQLHFENISSDSSSKIEVLPVDILKELLSSSSLWSRSEDIVWNVIVKWIEYDKPQRQVYVPDLLKCLKVMDMSQDLLSMIIKHNVIASKSFFKHISEPKTSNPTGNILQIFCDFLQIHNNPVTEFDNYRLPKMMYIFTRTTTNSRQFTRSMDIYFTYDDCVEIWRKFKNVEFDTERRIIIIGKRICVFRNYFLTADNYFFYDIDDESRTIEPENNEVFTRHMCAVVKHRNLLYVLGGRLEETMEDTGRVQAYNPALNSWNEVAPMIPIRWISAVSLGENIFVIGFAIRDSTVNTPCMVAQKYTPESDIWTSIAPPQASHVLYDLVVFRQRLYFIAGRTKTIEVYDPTSNHWDNFTDLPFAYNSPKARVLLDKLIVQENDYQRYSWSKPIVYWNDELECWEPIGDSTLVNNLYRYKFDVVDDFDTLMALRDENRKYTTSFEKSPFTKLKSLP